jgi:hypothetical protein
MFSVSRETRDTVHCLFITFFINEMSRSLALCKRNLIELHKVIKINVALIRENGAPTATTDRVFII